MTCLCDTSHPWHYFMDTTGPLPLDYPDYPVLPGHHNLYPDLIIYPSTFIMHEPCLHLHCPKQCTWATQEKNLALLTEAYHTSRNVLLFFSVNNSRAFQGYARMSSSPSTDIPPPAWTQNLLWVSPLRSSSPLLSQPVATTNKKACIDTNAPFPNRMVL